MLRCESRGSTRVQSGPLDVRDARLRGRLGGGVAGGTLVVLHSARTNAEHIALEAEAATSTGSPKDSLSRA
jgi:hypothetical protein